MPALETFDAAFTANALQFLLHQLANQRQIDLAPVFEDTSRIVQPLPDLGARDFRGGGIFHQIIKRHAAEAAEPRFQVLNGHADVVAQALLRNRALWHFEQLLRRDIDVIAQPVGLVRLLPKNFVEFLSRDLNQARMSYPGAVVPIVGFAALVLAYLLQRFLVGGGV